MLMTSSLREEEYSTSRRLFIDFSLVVSHCVIMAWITPFSSALPDTPLISGHAYSSPLFTYPSYIYIKK